MNRFWEHFPRRSDWAGILLVASTLAGLYFLSRRNFLLFHCLVEAFAIIIAVAVFTVFWNTRYVHENGVYVILGLGAFCAVVLDLIYILAYQGMAIFAEPDGNVALQAKTAAQWFVAGSCVAAFGFLWRRVNPARAVVVYGLLLAAALGSIFWWRVMPDCWRDGRITAFERLGLAISLSGYLIALGLLVRHRRAFDPRVFIFLAATLSAFFLEDLVCALAVELNGPARTIGHLLQVVALCFAYKAFVDLGLKRPYTLLFHSIEQGVQALRASEARYRVLVETIPQLAWRSSADGLEIECNRRWFEYTGQTPRDVQGHGWLAAVHPDDRLNVVAHAARAGYTKEPYQVEYRLRRAADGSYRWHLARAIAALNAAGEVECWFGSAMDIEDLKQAQEILKTAHDEQLLRHQAELAHVARLSMMGEMTATLAHELNQPLHAVKNYAYGCGRRLKNLPEPDAEALAALDQIAEEAQRAAEIIRRVRAFVQKREFHLTAMDVNAAVQEVLGFSKMDLQRHRILVCLDLAADLPPAVGDKIQVEQVLMNLVRNGVEAMDHSSGERRLVVRTLRLDESNVQIDVSDVGKGIDAAELEQVFEPFFTTKPEGMGMGLPISRSIVQAHGGRLWASANAGPGCTFHFTLPVNPLG